MLCYKSYTREYETFTKLKQYKGNNGLINVSPEFHFYVEKLEKKLISIFDTKCYIENISKEIIKELIKIKPPTACINFPFDKFISFFVRLRIYYLLKFENQRITSKSKSKILKQFRHV